MADNSIPANEALLPSLGEGFQRKPFKHPEDFEITYLDKVKIFIAWNSKNLDYRLDNDLATTTSLLYSNGPIWEKWSIPELEVYAFKNEANKGWLVYGDQGTGDDHWGPSVNLRALWQLNPSGRETQIQLYDDPDVIDVRNTPTGQQTVIIKRKIGGDNELWIIEDADS